MVSARIGAPRARSIDPLAVRTCWLRRQIRTCAPGNRPASIWASRKRGRRASRSVENPGGMAMIWVILGPIMNDRPKNWPALSLEEAHAQLTAPGGAFETAEISVRGVRLSVWKHVPATAAEVFLRAQAHGTSEFL